MSHYCCLILTKEFPTDEVLENVLAPYNANRFYEQPEESRVYPCFLWDYWQVGGRYAGAFKLSTENREKYDFDYYVQNPRCGRLFRSYLLEKMKYFAEKWRKPNFMYREEDFFSSMGFYDGYLYVDGAEICDIKNFSDVDSYIFIDQNGTASARSSWDGHKWNDNAAFLEEYRQAKDNSLGCYACVVDIHD